MGSGRHDTARQDTKPRRDSDSRLDAAIVRAAKSQERYRLLFEQTPAGLLTYDRDLIIRDVNASLVEILRSDRPSLVGLDMHRLRDPSVLPALEAALAGDSGTYLGSYRATTSSANLWISLRSVPLRDPVSNEITGGIGIVEDVTERREAEEVQTALYEISEAVHDSADLDALYCRIHEVVARLMPAENLYIALWDADTEMVRFPYFVDRQDPPPQAHKAGAGLTEHVLRSGESLLMTRDEIRRRIEEGAFRARGALPAFWLGVPLRTQKGTLGAMALQSYDEAVRIEPAHHRMLGFVAAQVAQAIERKRSEAQIERMAYFDSLTDLYNRRMLHEQAAHVLAQARRHGRQAALLYLDLDRFKQVNDTLGHDAGDDLLVEIGGVLRRFVRKSDVLARLGGDEFALLLPESGEMQAGRSAARLLETLDRTFELRGRRVHVGASVGVAIFPEHGADLDVLLKHADIAMYNAKDQGGGFAFFRPERSPYSVQRLDLESKLRQDLVRDALEVHYQPIFDIASLEACGVEALVRWNDEDGVPIAASEFVPMAEESSLIVRLDRWVLGRSVRELADRATTRGRHRLAVNISARSLQDPDLMHHIRSELAGNGMAAEWLMLEVTESTAIRDLEMSSRVLGELRDLGIGIALDDFGSGFASINYLRRLPCDRLKIDMELTSEIGRSVQGEKLLETAMMLGRALDLEILAEGIERQEQLEWLRDRGCDLGQGYLLGRPVPLERDPED